MKMPAPSVLVVDDDWAMTDLLELTLRKCGFEVTTVHHAIHAMTIQHESPHDLVIMDINMPGGSGLCVGELLKSDPNVVTPPMIIVSGRSDAATKLRCKKLGAHYVQKGADAVSRVRALARQLLSSGLPRDSESSGLYLG